MSSSSPLPFALLAGVPKSLFLKVRPDPIPLTAWKLAVDMDLERPAGEGKGTLGLDTDGAKVWEWQREVAKVHWGKSRRARSFRLS